VIPQSVWSEPAKHLLQYIPTPNSGEGSFSTSAEAKRLRDDKGSARLDFVSKGLGTLSGYYYIDDYNLDNPYPSGREEHRFPGLTR
jgi:hypothetical protein